MNKILTLDKMAESSRGAFIYTLLGGKALEAVEHLEWFAMCPFAPLTMSNPVPRSQPRAYQFFE